MQYTLYPTVILAGGLATRLHPITKTIPKSLIEIDGEPFIHHQLRALHREGVRDVIICIGFLGEMIQQVVGDGRAFNLNVTYSTDGPTLLGTGGAIKSAIPLLHDAFFVIYGDSYLTADFAAIQTKFIQEKRQGLMTVFKNNGQWDTSNVEYRNNQLIAYDKKNLNSRMHYIDYGLGMFTQSAFDRVPAGVPYDLATLYQSLLQENQLTAYEVHTRFYEIGSFTGIKELQHHLSHLTSTEKE